MNSWSLRRSRMTLDTTASDILEEDDVSLNKVMEVLTRSEVRGPYALQACHKGAVRLGAGAQFDVYGRRMPVVSGFPRFDGPYLKEPEWKMENSSPQTFVSTARHVAIKRAYLREFRAPRRAVNLQSADGRGVQRSQLRNVTHEILALVHPLLRQHPNIITLLGWGYDQAENDTSIFAPVLIVEHARMSAEALSIQTDLPIPIRMHICHGMLSGIKALHECRIVHSDIKPGNVLVFARHDSPFFCIAKLSDFGFAEQEIRNRSVDLTEMPRGTAGWAAPEQEAGDLVPVDLIHRRDIYGCGLTVWSIMALRGQVPDICPDVAARMSGDMVKGLIPAELTKTLLPLLNSCLCNNVVQRADSVEDVRSVLERSTWVESTEVKDRFRAIFTETVDWQALAAETVMQDGQLSTVPITPQNERKRQREKRMSWNYSLDRATAYNARDLRLLKHLTTEGCSVTEMFNISLAHAIDNRYVEELQKLQETAERGFLPAQALYPLLANYLPMRANTGVTGSGLDLMDWAYRAASSGFLFADISGLDQSLILEARQVFRDQGGYNAHYCGVKTQDQRSDGLVGNVEIDLHDSPLHLAAAFDDIVTPHGVSSLLNSNVSIDSHNHWQDTALMKCCMAGHLASTRALINHGANASIANPYNGLSPLHWLFVFKETEVAQAISLLVAGGASPKSPSIALAVKAFHFPFGWPSGTPLHWAVFARNRSAVQALLDHGADVFEVDSSGQDSLKIAMKLMDVELVRMLLHYCEKFRERDPMCSLADAYERHKYEPPTSRGEHASDSHLASIHDFMGASIIVGVDPDFEDWVSEDVVFPLDHYFAVFSGNHRAERCIEILKLFQQRYPTCLSWRTGQGFTPLDMALAFANPEPSIVQHMVANRSPIDARTIYEVLMGQKPPGKFGLDMGADYLKIILSSISREAARELVNVPLHNIVTEKSFASLHWVMQRGYVQCAQLLLDYGADPFLTQERCESPVEYARYLVDGNVTERMTKIKNTATWPGVAYELSKEEYAKEQVRMQGEADDNRRDILRLFETWRPAEARQ